MNRAYFSNMRTDRYMKAVLTVGAVLLTTSTASFSTAIAQSTHSSVDAEAQHEAKKWADKQIIECGKRFFAYWALMDFQVRDGKLYQGGLPVSPNQVWTLSEMKSFSYKAEGRALSEADRLNGIQWSGVLFIAGGAARGRTVRNGGVATEWGEWEDGRNFMHEILVGLQKKKGQWFWFRGMTSHPFYKEEPAPFDIERMPSMPSCSALTGPNPSLPVPDAQSVAFQTVQRQKQHAAELAKKERDEAQQQDQERTGIFTVGGDVSAPVITLKVAPQYAEEARQAKYQGTALVSLVVDANGNPQDIRIAKSLGLGLDERAIEAVQKWRFKPGMKAGKPVKVRIQVEVNFRLL
jgi:TonB family protein